MKKYIALLFITHLSAHALFETKTYLREHIKELEEKNKQLCNEKTMLEKQRAYLQANLQELQATLSEQQAMPVDEDDEDIELPFEQKPTNTKDRLTFFTLGASFAGVVWWIYKTYTNTPRPSIRK